MYDTRPCPSCCGIKMGRGAPADLYAHDVCSFPQVCRKHKTEPIIVLKQGRACILECHMTGKHSETENCRAPLLQRGFGTTYLKQCNVCWDKCALQRVLSSEYLVAAGYSTWAGIQSLKLLHFEGPTFPAISGFWQTYSPMS
jgi:hypothetical protein